MPALTWDIFCRVIDNFGDVGVCWRLARELAARGDAVRLVIDDAAALAWMAPDGAPGVEVLPWPGPPAPAAPPAAAAVVVEAFGCDPPPGYVAAMAAMAPAPVWINLEYLSAEDYVERCHGLPSPQPAGLQKWFFYPGFTPRTGGLLREARIGAPSAADDAAMLAALGMARRAGERLVSLFCYDNPALPALLDSLAPSPTLLLLTPGPAQRQVTEARPGLRLARLPWLTHDGYDRLLQACDLNFVRGEDSLVRAIWADRPFVWQIYPQDDGAHFAKLQALLQRMQLPEAVVALWRAWNGWPGQAWPGLPPLQPWQCAQARWRRALMTQPDLATQLRGFALGKARGSC